MRTILSETHRFQLIHNFLGIEVYQADGTEKIQSNHDIITEYFYIMW